MLIGYNNPWFFNQFKNGNFYAPDNVISSIKKLNPNILRYPGGTLGNFYTYINESGFEVPGYGFESTTAKGNFITRQVDLSIRTLTNTIFVANIYQALINPNQIKYRIEDTLNVLTKLPNTKYVELGNEIHISGEYMQVADKPALFESTTTYINKVNAKANYFIEIADKFYTEIKIEFPELKVGIPMANPFTIKNKEWNKVLRTWGKNDGEVFHIYATTKTYIETEKYIKSCIAGALKPIYITEWSWQHGNSSNNVLNSYDINKDYYLRFYKEFPEICEKLNIELICRHQLYGDNVYSVIKKT